MYVMDLSDITKPKPFGKVQYEFDAIGTIPFHTCYPVISDPAHPRLQNIVIAAHEALEADCRRCITPYVVDVKDPRIRKTSAVSRPQARPMPPTPIFASRADALARNAMLARPASRGRRSSRSRGSTPASAFSIYQSPRLEVAWFVPPHERDEDHRAGGAVRRKTYSSNLTAT
jgi:hypothetical protein